MLRKVPPFCFIFHRYRHRSNYNFRKFCFAKFCENLFLFIFQYFFLKKWRFHRHFLAKKLIKAIFFRFAKKYYEFWRVIFKFFALRAKNLKNSIFSENRIFRRKSKPAKSRGLPMVFKFWPFQAKIIFFRFAHEFFRFREKILLILVYFFSLREKNNFFPLRGKKLLVKMHLRYILTPIHQISNIFIDFCMQKSIKISLHDLPRVYENRRNRCFLKISFLLRKK